MTLDRVNTPPGAAPELWRIGHMSKSVRDSDAETDHRRAELVQAMKEAYPAFTLEEIGQAAGISRQRVQQLLAKEGT